MSEEFEKLRSKLDDNEAKIAQLRSEATAVKDALCAHCPVSIGDVVAVNTGYSHYGKEIIVDRVVYLHTVIKSWDNRGEMFFLCSGQVLKKDRTAGVHIGKHECALNN